MANDPYIELADEALDYLKIVLDDDGNNVLLWTLNGLVEIGRSIDNKIIVCNFHTDHLELYCGLDEASIQAIQEYEEHIVKWIEDKGFTVRITNIPHEHDE